MKHEKLDLHVVLKGAVTTLREVADDLETLGHKNPGKFVKKVREAIKPAAAAILLIEHFADKLHKSLPENQLKQAAIPDYKKDSVSVLTEDDVCRECKVAHYGSCDADEPKEAAEEDTCFACGNPLNFEGDEAFCDTCDPSDEEE